MLTKKTEYAGSDPWRKSGSFCKQYEGLTFDFEYSVSDTVSDDAGRTWRTDSKMRMGIL